MYTGRSITHNPFDCRPADSTADESRDDREDWLVDWERKERQKTARPPAGKKSAWSPDTDDGRFTPSPVSSSRSSVHGTGHDMMELPPPYSEKQQYQEQAERYMTTLLPPSPQAISPQMTTDMMSQRGGLGLTTMPPAPEPAAVQDARLPDRAIGTFVPGEHAVPMSGAGPRQETERQRRRHEKEDFVAHKLFSVWAGRGCFSQNGYLGRPGREGRKRRRIALAICGAVLALLIAGIVLGVTLIHRATTPATNAGAPAAPSKPAPFAQPSFYPVFDLATFPPIPTGVLTVVGASNSVNTSDCIDHASMWTCALPPEQAVQAGKYDVNQPTFVLQIQYDDSDLQQWNQPPGSPPVPSRSTTPPPASVPGQGPWASATPGPSYSIERRDSRSAILSSLRRLLRRSGTHTPFNDGVTYDVGFTPNPQPPDYQEYWFLSNTSDGVVSDRKAGEATPFYISMLSDVKSPVGPNQLGRRGSRQRGIVTTTGHVGRAFILPGNNQTATNLSTIVPPPEVKADGTGAPARLVPLPTQQPLRLFDRGLPTEHYGFFTYFNKTVYVHSVQAGAAEPAGGAPMGQAQYVATFGQARYKVQIWTRLGGGGGGGAQQFEFVGAAQNGNASGVPWAGGYVTQPGTFPFPITVTVDLHGGGPPKFAYWRPMQGGAGTGRPDGATAGLLAVNMTARAGDVAVNPSSYVAAQNNPTFGGYNGGLGGCECRWQNFAMVDGSLGPALANPFGRVSSCAVFFAQWMA